MKGEARLHKFIVFVLFMMAACVEPYLPPPAASDANFFVVDGYLNGTDQSATVKLSRAIPLPVGKAFPVEEGAVVSVEGDKGTSFMVPETGLGIYKAEDLDIDASENYRVHILTRDGKSYRSDYVEMRRAPVIDSVSWRGEAKGTRLFVSSHDDSNSTLFYRYLFTETWEYRVPLYSFWKNEGGRPVFRNPDTEQVFTCWKSSNSTEILTTSTKRLNSDVVSMFPLTFIDQGARLLSRRYSIVVHQMAISQEEFDYWQIIRKTTETLGGLFDPLPSQVIGNVRSEEDPNEQVLGYFSGGYVTDKRIFISASELPSHLQVVDGWDFPCEERFIPLNDLQQIDSDVFVAQVGQPPVGFSAASQNCADCKSIGGNNIPPAFWIP